MYCSTKCMETSESYIKVEIDKKCSNFYWRIFFKSLDICGGSLDKLKEILRFSSSVKFSNKTIFDFDLSNPNDPLYNYNLLLTVNSLKLLPMIQNDSAAYMIDYCCNELFKNPEERQIAKVFMARFYQISQKNSFQFSWVDASKVPANPMNFDSSKVIGRALFPFGSLLNHSCIPNIETQAVDNKFAYIVRLPIAKGEQIFSNYG